MDVTLTESAAAELVEGCATIAQVSRTASESNLRGRCRFAGLRAAYAEPVYVKVTAFVDVLSSGGGAKGWCA